MSTPKNPAIGVLCSSIFFLISGILLIIGFIKAYAQFGFNPAESHMYSFYVFLIGLCFSLSYGIYAHKKWALYTAFTFGVYLIINFVIDLWRFSFLDILILGLPIMTVVSVLLFSLYHKKHHFIN